MSHKPNKDKV